MPLLSGFLPIIYSTGTVTPHCNVIVTEVRLISSLSAGFIDLSGEKGEEGGRNLFHTYCIGGRNKHIHAWMNYSYPKSNRNVCKMNSIHRIDSML